MIAKPFDGPLKSIYFHIRYNMKIVYLRPPPPSLPVFVLQMSRMLFFSGALKYRYHEQRKMKHANFQYKQGTNSNQTLDFRLKISPSMRVLKCTLQTETRLLVECSISSPTHIVQLWKMIWSPKKPNLIWAQYMLTQLHNYLMCYVHVHLDFKHLKIAENNLVLFSKKPIFNKLPIALYVY